jgi:hypothetical protein
MKVSVSTIRLPSRSAWQNLHPIFHGQPRNITESAGCLSRELSGCWSHGQRSFDCNRACVPSRTEAKESRQFSVFARRIFSIVFRLIGPREFVDRLQISIVPVSNEFFPQIIEKARWLYGAIAGIPLQKV